MHVFTSITANYLPKAAALAHSVKRVHPDAVFHVVLSDEMPACAPRDVGVRLDHQHPRLGIDDLPGSSSATAWWSSARPSRGPRSSTSPTDGAERIYYFDPDIIVADRLDGLERALDAASVLLTPHSIEPETDLLAILDNEHCCLRNGVYNLGFLAVRTDGQQQFIDWWADRLRRTATTRCRRPVHRPALGRPGPGLVRRHHDPPRAPVQRLHLEPDPPPATGRRPTASRSTAGRWSSTTSRASTAAPSS